MHFIIAFLTAAASLIWALHHLGVDVHSLNPFNWHRRSRWRKAYNTKPLHLLNKPIEVATVLLVSLVTTEGLVSREQKQELIRIFKEDFQQTESDAANYFGSATFLLKDTLDVVDEVPQILGPSRKNFTEEQINSLLSLMSTMATFEGEITDTQKKLISAVETELIGEKRNPGTW